MHRSILVKTCQKNRDRRMACDATWAAALRRCGIRVLFVEGGSILPRIANHMLSLPVPDDYESNTKKVAAALSWGVALDRAAAGWFVCDDDTFVHPRRWMAHAPSGELECRLYFPQGDELRLNAGKPWIAGGAGWSMSHRACEAAVSLDHNCRSADDIACTRAIVAAGMEPVDRPDLYGWDDAGEVSAGNHLMTCHRIGPERMRELFEETRDI